MSTDVLFELDTSGESSRRSSRLFYTTSGDLDLKESDSVSKPSQERPPILKMKTKRYHEMANKDKFKPGEISEELRRALGLRKNDIPLHIYRMRHLGYPPGWLRRAEVKTDSIKIFGHNNECFNANETNAVKYDCEKLFEYPGFNSYKHYNSRFDRCVDYGYMEMDPNSLIANFRQFLDQQQMLGKEATDITDIRRIDTSRDSNNDFCFAAPIKRKLPMACSTPFKQTKPDDLSDGELVDEEDEDSIGLVSMTDSVSEDNSAAPTVPVLPPPPPPPQAAPISTPAEDGTVIIVPSIIEKPSLDRFSEGINEHRLFENLPNSGGTYQRVRDVLKRIRN